MFEHENVEAEERTHPTKKLKVFAVALSIGSVVAASLLARCRLSPACRSTLDVRGRKIIVPDWLKDQSQTLIPGRRSHFSLGPTFQVAFIPALILDQMFCRVIARSNLPIRYAIRLCCCRSSCGASSHSLPQCAQPPYPWSCVVLAHLSVARSYHSAMHDHVQGDC